MDAVVYKKVDDVLDVANTLQKPRGTPTRGSFSTALTVLQTALNISGKGRLIGLLVNNSAVEFFYIKILIDGAVYAWGRGGGSGMCYPYLGGLLFYNQNGTSDIFSTTVTSDTHAAAFEVNYNQSLQIQVAGSGSNTVTVYWLYETE
jgi:hypothetical protein